MNGAPTAQLAAACARFGFDLSGVTVVGAYNPLVDEAFRLPGRDDSAVLVIGNTSALWPKLTEFVRSSSTPLADPVDFYSEQSIESAVRSTIPADMVIDLRFAHEPPPRRIAIQRLAQVAGLAWLSPSHLCIHHEFGPWIALRAAIVLDHRPEAVGTPAQPTCDCAAHCLPAFERALAAGVPDGRAQLEKTWELWLAARDACRVGRKHRYSDEQILYHYTGARPIAWL